MQQTSVRTRARLQELHLIEDFAGLKLASSDILGHFSRRNSYEKRTFYEGMLIIRRQRRHHGRLPSSRG